MEETQEEIAAFQAYQAREEAFKSINIKLSIPDLINCLIDECALWGPALNNIETPQETFDEQILTWSTSKRKGPIITALFNFKEWQHHEQNN